MKNKDIYSQSEVDELVKEMLTQSNVTVSKQRDKINELKAEIMRLQTEIDDFEERENEVAETIEKYQNKSKYFENIIKMRCEMEIARLDDLEEMLQGDLVDKTHVGEILGTIKKSLSAFASDVTEVDEISKLDPEKDEVDVGDDLEKRYLKILALYEFNKATEDKRGRGRPKKEVENFETFLLDKKKSVEKQKYETFDIEEALHPTQSLEDIMQEIMDDN